MEPLDPKVRAALIKSNPGLTDQVIDRVEELLAQRMLYDPDTEADQIAQLDRERIELIRDKIPNYAEVVRAARERLAKAQQIPKRKVTVILKKRDG